VAWRDFRDNRHQRERQTSGSGEQRATRAGQETHAGVPAPLACGDLRVRLAFVESAHTFEVRQPTSETRKAGLRIPLEGS
jgi:hypothetical protein